MTRAKAAKEKNDSELGVLGVLAGANPRFHALRGAGKICSSYETFQR
jgi:hypothetical protein